MILLTGLAFDTLTINSNFAHKKLDLEQLTTPQNLQVRSLSYKNIVMTCKDKI